MLNQSSYDFYVKEFHIKINDEEMKMRINIQNAIYLARLDTRRVKKKFPLSRSLIHWSFLEIELRILRNCYFATFNLLPERPRVITEHSQHVQRYEKIWVVAMWNFAPSRWLVRTQRAEGHLRGKFPEASTKARRRRVVLGGITAFQID